MKYSKEFKLECVRKYKNGEYIKDPPGVKHAYFHSQIKKAEDKMICPSKVDN